MKPEVVQAAFNQEPAFHAWGLTFVGDPQVADLRLTVDRILFTWTWTYELVHQNTGIVLDTGRLKATWDYTAAEAITHAVTQRISAARGLPAGDRRRETDRCSAPRVSEGQERCIRCQIGDGNLLTIRSYSNIFFPA
jgi:hypothetical protein